MKTTPRTPRTSRRTAAALALSLLAALLTLGGCSEPVIENGALYPDDRKQTRVVDVQVLRDETEITMTNTAASDLPPGRLWINAWYSLEFPGLAIGQTTTLSLAEFKDRFGGAFQAGGFFATERPDNLVQVQLEANDALIGLVVIRPVE